MIAEIVTFPPDCFLLFGLPLIMDEASEVTLSLIYSMLMSVDGYVEDEHGIRSPDSALVSEMQIESQLELVSVKR